MTPRPDPPKPHTLGTGPELTALEAALAFALCGAGAVIVALVARVM